MIADDIFLHLQMQPVAGIGMGAGKVFVDSKNRGVLGREVTISNVAQHYDFNAATMISGDGDGGTVTFDELLAT